MVAHNTSSALPLPLEDLIAELRSARPELVHYAGAAHRDPVALQVCLAYLADRTAPEYALKSYALKSCALAALGVVVSPEQIRAVSVKGAGYGARVDALLDRLGADLTARDFLDLALACLDQSGLPVRDQAKVMLAVEEHMDSQLPGDPRDVLDPRPDAVDPRLAVDVNVDAYGRRTVRR